MMRILLALLFVVSPACQLASPDSPTLSCSAPELKTCQACVDRGCGWCPASGSSGVCCRASTTCPASIRDPALCPAPDPCSAQASCGSCQNSGCFWCPSLGCLGPQVNGAPPQCPGRIDPADECAP